jgi:hypothetical protein
VAGLGDRIRRLEAARGMRAEATASEERHRRVMDRLYHVLENGRRELQGLDPLPPPEVSPEDTREDILHTLTTTIPHYRARGGWYSGEGAEFLAEWENRELEKLSELEKGNSE